jgi:hypothetical protein
MADRWIKIAISNEDTAEIFTGSSINARSLECFADSSANPLTGVCETESTDWTG